MRAEEAWAVWRRFDNRGGDDSRFKSGAHHCEADDKQDLVSRRPVTFSWRLQLAVPQKEIHRYVPLPPPPPLASPPCVGPCWQGAE